MDNQQRYQKAIDSIEENVEWVDIKPYSHNIITLNLRIIDEVAGNDEVNRVIEEYGLDELGWEINP